MSGGQHSPEALGGAAGKPHGRLARGQVHHPHVAPEDALAHGRAKRPGTRLPGAQAWGLADAAGHGATASARAWSISSRILLMLAASPTKIASPTRKCPMFSSTISGKRAIGCTVSNDNPWPAWTSRPSVAASLAADTRRSRSRSKAARPER